MRYVAPLTKQTSPQLNSNDSEDEKDEKTQQQDISQHWQGVKQQHDQNSHAWKEEKKFFFSSLTEKAT